MRQPRAPVNALEVPTFRAIIPAKMINAIMQAERLAAGHWQGPCSVTNYVWVPIKHLRTSNMFRKAVLWITRMPNPTLPSPTSEPKETKISSDECI